MEAAQPEAPGLNWPREEQGLAQGHTAEFGLNGDLDPGDLTLRECGDDLKKCLYSPCLAQCPAQCPAHGKPSRSAISIMDG